jgi:hypothetical protein
MLKALATDVENETVENLASFSVGLIEELRRVFLFGLPS